MNPDRLQRYGDTIFLVFMTTVSAALSVIALCGAAAIAVHTYKGFFK